MVKKGSASRIYPLNIHCISCGTLLYRYHKEGPGSLVKCYVDRIVEDRTRGDLQCPQCGQVFARPIEIHKRPAHKIIQGRVFVRGHQKK